MEFFPKGVSNTDILFVPRILTMMSFSNPKISVIINNNDRKSKIASIPNFKYLSHLGIFTYGCLIWN